MILQSRRIWVLNDWLDAQIEVSGITGRIEGIYPYADREADVDYGDLRIVPGFIDVHTHGAYGFDTNDAEEEGLRNWLKNIVSEGVTGLLPTTITQSEEVLTSALRNVAGVEKVQRADPEKVPGARILGIHLEGPYLDQTYKGAQPEQFCVMPDPDQFRRYLAASEGLIRIVTLACEHDEGYRLTRFLSENGIVPSLGHSSATCAQAAMAFANGARSVTHVYNGMAPFHHREPGIPGASFRFRNVFGEIICDGLHSSWAALNVFFESKGPDYGVMISDALRVKGLPPGTRATFGGHEIELREDGCAYLAETGADSEPSHSMRGGSADPMETAAGSDSSHSMRNGGVHRGQAGTLAGSTLKINEGLRNLVEKAGVPWQTAINACTLNPARLIGLERTKGAVRTGMDADLVVLRNDYSVEATYVGGKKVFG